MRRHVRVTIEKHQAFVVVFFVLGKNVRFPGGSFRSNGSSLWVVLAFFNVRVRVILLFLAGVRVEPVRLISEGSGVVGVELHKLFRAVVLGRSLQDRLGVDRLAPVELPHRLSPVVQGSLGLAHLVRRIEVGLVGLEEHGLPGADDVDVETGEEVEELRVGTGRGVERPVEAERTRDDDNETVQVAPLATVLPR